MQKGVATFTLDYGKCPPWLFERMVKLSRSMAEVMVAEYGPDEFIKRIADPVWFQSLGTVLAFDWNASGLTTILTAALKEAIRGQERDLGLFICGGKGKTSRKTPDEILLWGEKLNLPEQNANNLVYNSKMSAKVDSALLQDGYQIYHHAFFFSRDGAWTVVQQGMNTDNQTARRYHWHSANINDLIVEPHSGISSPLINKPGTTLDMTAKKGENNRSTSVEMINSGYNQLIKDINLIRKYSNNLSQMVSFEESGEKTTFLHLEGKEFHSHKVMYEDFSKSKYLEKILTKVTEQKPDSYEKLLATEGVGPKTIRALSLVSEVIYGAEASYEDPARYSFAHGGKDATPYPVDKPTYDITIDTLKEVVKKTKLTNQEKNNAIKRLTNKQEKLKLT